MLLLPSILSYTTSNNSVVLVGYTPRGLDNLPLQHCAAMASLGFPYTPASSTEFWSFDEVRRTLVRHHPVRRTTWFVPTRQEPLPVSLTALSKVAAVQQVRRTLGSFLLGKNLCLFL